MRGRIGKRLPTISFTGKPSLRQPEQRAMASPRPANPPASATPLGPGTGTQTDRSVAQTGPDVAEQRAKQEIRDQKHFGRSTVEVEKIFLAGKNDHEKYFGHARFFSTVILHPTLPQHEGCGWQFVCENCAQVTPRVWNADSKRSSPSRGWRQKSKWPRLRR